MSSWRVRFRDLDLVENIWWKDKGTYSILKWKNPEILLDLNTPLWIFAKESFDDVSKCFLKLHIFSLQRRMDRQVLLTIAATTHPVVVLNAMVRFDEILFSLKKEHSSRKKEDLYYWGLQTKELLIFEVFSLV